ncbi:MAG: GNAT family N-acetyltransferase [Bacilli bacterium]|nr:GNAT family N-acetyltransferase [Bacilli bacterium]
MKFYLEKPSIERKEEALEYLDEHVRYASDINGSGGLDKCLEGVTYEDWLLRLEKIKDEGYARSVNRCPGETFFLIRKEDNKLVGMLNIRHKLTDAMLEFAGHIGYGIRPTERQKGYNKINLYLGLIKAHKDFGLDRVMLGCSADNLGSDKTIKALGGVLEKSEIDPLDGELTNVYWIDVEDSINRYSDTFREYIDDGVKLINK